SIRRHSSDVWNVGHPNRESLLRRSRIHPTLMATNSPLLPPGQQVKYNATTQDPRATGPSTDEQGIGVIRQSFTKADGPYYQVVWNPGSNRPKSALYH